MRYLDRVIAKSGLKPMAKNWGLKRRFRKEIDRSVNRLYRIQKHCINNLEQAIRVALISDWDDLSSLSPGDVEFLKSKRI